MKKILLTFFTLLIIVSLVFVGCNEPPVTDENPDTETTQQPSGGNQENSDEDISSGGNQQKPNEDISSGENQQESDKETSDGGNQQKPDEETSVGENQQKPDEETSEDGNNSNPTGAVVSDVLLSKSSDYSEESPKLVAKAKYDDSSEKDVTSEATWTSSDVGVATVSAGEISILSTGTTVITATYSNVESGKATITVTENVSSGEIDKLYFITSTTWSASSPRYAAYFFGAGDNWVDMTEHSSGVYVCDKLTEYPSVIFCRMDPTKSENNWNNRWNQTADLKIPLDKDTYKYDDGNWDKGTGEWLSDLTGNYSSDTDSTYSVKVSIKNTNNYVDEGNSGGSSTVTLSDDWNNLRIYQVMVSSFQDGDSSRGYQYAYGPNNALKGGDLQGIINAADYIEDLGCNAIWMTPIFNSNGDGYLDSTGYFTYDYFNVDPKFGTNETFRKLVETYHEKGIYVILDGVFGHWGANVAASPTGKKPTRSNGQYKACDYPASLEFFKEVATYWIKEYKIDGWRLDQCYQVALGENAQGTISDNTATNGHNYWYEIRSAVEEAAAENKANGEDWGTLGYMVGEHWRGDAETIQKGSIDPGPNGVGYGLKSCFDFPSRYRLIQTIAREEGSNSSTDFGGALTYTYGTSTEKGYYHPDGYWPNLFITNHDLVRLGNLINWKFSETPSSDNFYKRHNVAMAVLAAYSGPITIYYGDEWGAYVDGYTGDGALGAYNDNAARSTGKISGFTAKEKSCLDYSSALMKMRSENPVLWKGENETLESTTSYYVGKKTLGTEEVIFIINNGPTSVSYNCSGTDLISGENISGSVTCDGISARFIKIK